jgi:hypothetical protein
MRSALWHGIRACGWRDIRQSTPAFLRAPQATSLANPANSVRSYRILGFASDRGEIVDSRSRAVDPAASADAFPKRARALAAGGSCRTLVNPMMSA